MVFLHQTIQNHVRICNQNSTNSWATYPTYLGHTYLFPPKLPTNYQKMPETIPYMHPIIPMPPCRHTGTKNHPPSSKNHAKTPQMVKSGQTSGQTGQKWSKMRSAHQIYSRGKVLGKSSSTYLRPYLSASDAREAARCRYI